MKLLVRLHGGVGCDGHNSMNLLVRSHGGVVCDGLTQVVRVARGPSLLQDNGLRSLKANLVRGRVKPIGNGSVE